MLIGKTRAEKLFSAISAPLFFSILTIIVTWPLVLHLNDRIPGWYIADNYEYLWKIWWFKHAIADLQINPLFAPHILYPGGFSLAYAEITPLHTVVGLPLTMLWGEVLTYNFFALASFFISGLAVFQLIKKVTGSTPAGLFSGILFILNPYHIVRYGGILPLMSIEGIPIFLLGIEEWISSRKTRWILLAAIGYMMAAWSSIYYAFGLLLLGTLYIFLRLLFLKTPFFNRKTIQSLALLVLLAAVFTIPLTIPYFTLRSSSSLVIPLQDTDYWSASLTDFLIPTGLHPLWGSLVRENLLGVPTKYPQIALEFVLSGGFIATLFALYGSIRSRVPGKKALIGFTITALILSLGPTLHFARHPVVIPASPLVIQTFNEAMDAIGQFLPAHESFSPLAKNGITIPLPALLLRWLFPVLTGMRAWNRFVCFSSLCISLLAGIGFSEWIKTELKPKLSPKFMSMIIGCFFILSLFELWPGQIPIQSIGPRPVDLWLAEQPETGSLIELPISSSLVGPQMLYTRYHNKPISFAYGTYLPYWYRERYPELENCPSDECFDRLRGWGVSFVLLDLTNKSKGLSYESQLDNSPSLDRIIRVGDHVVYRLQY